MNISGKPPGSLSSNGYIDRNGCSYICGIAPSKDIDTIENTQSLRRMQQNTGTYARVPMDYIDENRSEYNITLRIVRFEKYVNIFCKW